MYIRRAYGRIVQRTYDKPAFRPPFVPVALRRFLFVLVVLCRNWESKAWPGQPLHNFLQILCVFFHELTLSMYRNKGRGSGPWGLAKRPASRQQVPLSIAVLISGNSLRTQRRRLESVAIRDTMPAKYLDPTNVRYIYVRCARKLHIRRITSPSDGTRASILVAVLHHVVPKRTAWLTNQKIILFFVSHPRAAQEPPKRVRRFTVAAVSRPPVRLGIR